MTSTDPTPQPTPTDAAHAARAVLIETALPEVDGRFGVPAATVREIAQLGAEQSLAALGAPPSAHAGWTLLLAGGSLARSSDELGPVARDGAEDPSVPIGVAWAGLVAGAVGDRMLTVREHGGGGVPDVERVSGGGRERVRAVARELTDAVLAPVSSPPARRRLAEDVIEQLDAGVHDLDHATAGWALCATGAWTASRAQDITGPLHQRRGLLRRAPELPMVATGCERGGALLAQVGLILLESR